jgi:SAM-dependent methyltransferase
VVRTPGWNLPIDVPRITGQPPRGRLTRGDTLAGWSVAAQRSCYERERQWLSSSIDAMIRQLLESPVVYELSQFLWYRKGKQLEYVTKYAQARSGESVLDIGCGVGAVAAYFPGGVYHGFDSNKAYVEYANRKYGGRAVFTYGEVGTDVEVEKARYDLVMANGLLHHLNDREVMHLLQIAYEALKPGGLLVTRDGCFE